MKDRAYPLWLLLAVIIGDGFFVTLQIPSPSFEGFGLTPFPLLIAETLTYLIGGYVVYRLNIYSDKRIYFFCFALVVVLWFALMMLDMPLQVTAFLQLVVYMALALLNLCWGVVFASFKPSVSVALVVGSYIIWSGVCLLFSLTGDGQGLMGMRMLFPFASLIILGFCLKRFDFGVCQKRFEPKEKHESFFELIKSIKVSVAATITFSLIFGGIMQFDVVRGASNFIVSPEAQIATIAVSLALLICVIRIGDRKRFQMFAIAVVSLALATVLMVRAVMEDQSFFTNGIPLALFNFFGQLVWIEFAWKGYESRANSFCIYALGLGSMRLGLLAGRGLVELLAQAPSMPAATADLVSIVGLWVLFIGVLAAVIFIVKRQNLELAPFEMEAAAPDGQSVVVGSAQNSPSSQFYGSVEIAESTTVDQPATPEMSATEPEEAKPDPLYLHALDPAAEVAGLTEREQEILALYASGRSAVRIAEDLYLSNYTVKTHLRRSYAKLGIHSRQELLDLMWNR